MLVGLTSTAHADDWTHDLTGWIQFDSIAWSERSVDELDPEADGDLLNEERFLVRRGRIRWSAQNGPIHGAFELDGNTIDGPAARILAASVGYAWTPRGMEPARDGDGHALPLLAVTAGLFRTPFGMEVPMAERVKPFLEPPTFARALFPGNYDGGAMVAGAWSAVRWAVGLVNGAPFGDAQWLGRDPSSSYDVVGRVGAAIQGPRRFRIEAGVSGITGSGFSAGSPATKDEIEWVDDNGDGIVGPSEVRVVPGSPGIPSETFDRDALGADVQAHWCLCVLGEGWAFVEAVLATNLDRGVVYADPIKVARDLRHSGFAIGIVQDLSKYARVGVRYDRYDGDRDASEQQGVNLVGVDKTFTTLSLMATARYGDARFLVQYDRERNPYGRGDDGEPTSLAADRLTLRAQVGF